MHRCIALPEIQAHIFCYLASDPRGRGRSSLAACARTSKPFAESALDILWSELPSLEPLVRSMPWDLWKKDYSGRVTFVRQLTKKDMNRCLHYAYRVRSLRIERHHDLVDETVYKALLEHTPPALLFPNLLSLVWTDRDPVYLPLFISTCLRTAHISFGVYNTTYSALFSVQHMMRVSPHLEDVAFPGPSARQISTSPEFLPVITSLRDVREFTCFVNSVSGECLRGLASWPKLRKLTLVWPAESERSSTWPDLSYDQSPVDILGTPFESLTHLDLTMNGTIPPAVLAQYPLLVNLKSVRVHLPDDSEASLIEDWLSDVSRHCSPHLLNAVSVHPAYRSQQPLSPLEPRHIFDCSVLRSLIPFANLRTLDITLRCAVLLDNAILQELAASWPHLQQLNIGVQSGSTEEPQVTSSGLLALLNLCPDLDYLGLVFDARTLHHGTHGRPGAGVCNDKITTIHVGNSLIRDPFDVAEFMSDILPSVREIKTVYQISLAWSSAAQSQNKLWKDVERLVPCLAKVRGQERNFRETVRK
ncbi:hypothetical protein NEOLEDRAFT_1177833 [Neolentinus lepideus HHB14362 ss-1]|uniref:F-box domain-containing protein n=1 Tax=Neolentinus lepideus HHB14362 ss-1 TaxID=1314782 RepID=A0A165T1T7_9AGAM|nr:hypothetical protein NEOLEDRAFT_1177833 [Neolentinus lepideus HHB14362 ss-1]